MDEIKTPEERFFAELEANSSRRNSDKFKFVFENNQETFDDSNFLIYFLFYAKRILNLSFQLSTI